jgi:hypothetical protein
MWESESLYFLLSSDKVTLQPSSQCTTGVYRPHSHPDTQALLSVSRREYVVCLNFVCMYVCVCVCVCVNFKLCLSSVTQVFKVCS